VTAEACRNARTDYPVARELPTVSLANAGDVTALLAPLVLPVDR
jgi:hypothetical protein